MNKNTLNTNTISMTGLMMALIFVFTFFVKFPIPLGYANLGSTMILIGAFLLGKVPGIIAGAIGPAIADFLLGYTQWCIPTLIVKGVMVVIYLIIAGNTDRLNLRVVIAAFVSNLWAVFGYTAGGALLYGGWGAGLSSTPGLLIEALINVFVFIVVLKMIAKTDLIKRIVNKRY